MALSIADQPGSPSCPFFLMPDLKNAPPVKQSLLHRLGLRKWLARDGHSSEPPSQFDPQDVCPDLQDLKNHNGDVTEDNDGANYNETPQSRKPANIGLPRNPTFKRQNSERREKLTPFEPGYRRAVSADRRRDTNVRRTRSQLPLPAPRLSAPALRWEDDPPDSFPYLGHDFLPDPFDNASHTEDSSEYGEDAEDALEKELDRKWILNLSMRFRDKSDREKFFVTYAEAPNRWRKVTISCDYRNAEPESLEDDLKQLYYHRDKNAQIYESIRDSIAEIQFYDTVTNLKLETRDSRLHVHVTEDVNEIIPYPSLTSVDYLDPLFVPESQLTFDTHLSGFVYRVKYKGKDYVKKEITGPDTIEEFLYEINALHALLGSESVIKFKGIIIDDTRTVVKGLLIDLAEKGALADLFYDCKGSIPWARREHWAKQVIKGLADIHEAGFVQGDFTVSNVVVDENDNAKLIDINRRGCPIGWEPPEFAKKLESKQRISMYIGVKSDLYQLGMTLWAIAMEEDEPGRQPRPLVIPVDMKVPEFYRDIVQICLSEKPQDRLSAKELLSLFPEDDPVTITNVADNSLQYSTHDDPNNIPPGYGIVDINLDQVDDTGFMEHHANSIQFASLPNSLSSLEERFRHHHPITPVLLPPSRSSSVDLDFVNSNARNAEHQTEYTYDNVVSLSGGCHVNLEAENPRQQQTNSFLAHENVQSHILDLSNPPSAISDVAILDSQDAGIELDIPFRGLPPMEPTGDSGYAYPSGICRHSQLLSCIGTHPSCSLDTHYMGTGEEITPSDSLSVSDILYQSHTKHVDLDSGSIRVDGESPLYPHEDDRIWSPEPESMDLFSSRLPINPAFISPEKPEPTTPYKCPNNQPDFQHKIPFNQIDLFFLSNDDLFTSMLPINPRFGEKPKRQLERYPSNTDDLFLTKLPINPSFTAPFPTESDSKIPVHASSSSTHNFSTSPRPNKTPPAAPKPEIRRRASESNDLFTSRLPINPAFTATSTTMTECRASVSGSPSFPQGPPTSNPLINPCVNGESKLKSGRRAPNLDDLFSSRLPINPAIPAVTSFSGIECISLVDNSDSASIKPEFTFALSTELLMSRLPINPAFSA